MQRHPTAYRRIAFSLMMLPLLALRPAATSLRVAGTIALRQGSSQPGRDDGGTAAFVGDSRGTNRSTGATDFLNGAMVVTADTSTLVNGTGHHHGTITISKGGDGVAMSWGGQVTTVMAGGKPSSTFTGTWTALSGSGRHSSAHGHGTYRGRFTSATTSVLEWEGTISE